MILAIYTAIIGVSPRNCHHGRYSGAQSVMKVLIRLCAQFMCLFSQLYRILTALLLLVGVSLSAKAQELADTPLDQLFTIRAITVDETDRSADRARRRALLGAESQAYIKLLQKITQQADRSLLPELTVAERQSLISGIEFVDEQSSSRRYIATLNVRFEPDRVSQFLAEYGVPHVLGTGRPVLVIHAHQKGLRQYLWDLDFTLSEARSSVDWLNRIRGYRFAKGAIKERLIMTSAEVFDFNLAQAEKITQLNGLRATTLIGSKMEQDSNGLKVLNYQYFATDSGVQGEGTIQVVNEDETAALVAMYNEILEIIDGAWRERLLVDTASSGEVRVLVPSRSLEEFSEVQKRLAAVTLVQTVETVSVALPLSSLQISFTGRADQLTMALRFEGLDLKPYGENMILELRP